MSAFDAIISVFEYLFFPTILLVNVTGILLFQQAGLARRVAELVTEYSQLQNCYHQQCAQRLRRQLQIGKLGEKTDTLSTIV